VGSSRDVEVVQVVRGGIALLAIACAAACSTGHGEGKLVGTVSIPGCRNGPYNLGPSAFFGQAVEQLLRIRVQRGSDLEVNSDGLAVLVTDATFVQREFLDQDIDIAGSVPRVDLSIYLNESCPPGRDKTPVVLPAVSGTIRFEAIYAPQVDDDEVQITATMSDLHFEDPRNPERSANLNGYFDFLYVRGSPSQRFP
jgi:hypothetical protein